ncbi:MAG: heme exporter protein CcmB [Bacteroidota bacterium]
MKKVLAVLYKDLFSEFRTRYSISTILLFVVTTVTMLAISTMTEKLSNGLVAGFVWIIMFFSAMTGLAKSFVSEEERGTSFLLKISTSSGAVYFGKLLYNTILSIAINSLAIMLLFLVFGSIEIKTYSIFLTNHFLGSLGLAGGTTIISAIIARAATKGALFPVLAFPIVLPLILLGIETTQMSFEGKLFSEAQTNLQLILAYCGIMITASYFLFHFIWEE